MKKRKTVEKEEDKGWGGGGGIMMKWTTLQSKGLAKALKCY